MGLTEMLFFAAVGLGKIPGELRWLMVQYTEKLFMSQIGASIEKMCWMKNATYGKNEFHVRGKRTLLLCVLFLLFWGCY